MNNEAGGVGEGSYWCACICSTGTPPPAFLTGSDKHANSNTNAIGGDGRKADRINRASRIVKRRPALTVPLH